MRGDWNIIWEVGGIFKKLILEEERLFGTPEYFKIMVKNVRTNDVHRIDRGVVANNTINQATNVQDKLNAKRKQSCAIVIM